MLPGVEAAVDAYAPDVLVADQQALAGAVIARRRGLPWVTSATTTAEFTRPFAGFPKVGEWVTDRIAGFLADSGAPGGWDPRFSDRLVLVFSTPELVGAGEAVSRALRLRRPRAGRPPGRRLVLPLAAAGSRTPPGAGLARHAQPRGRRPLLRRGPAGRRAPGRPGAADRGRTRGPGRRGAPDHVLLQEYVPQLALLPHLDAVVCHGGHNTVCEALAHGLPLVVAPVRDDQPIVAQQVAAAGAGIRVRFGRPRADELHAALSAVLDDPDHRRAARRIQASFAAAGGAAAAADRLEKLL